MIILADFCQISHFIFSEFLLVNFRAEHGKLQGKEGRSPFQRGQART